MQVSVAPLALRLKQPFRIAHGVSETRTNVAVRIGDGNGEAGLPPYLGTDYQSAERWLQSVSLPEWDSEEPPPVSTWIAQLPEGPAAARCAVDLALHDLWGQRLGHPLFRLFGLDPGQIPASYQTLSIPESLPDRSQIPEGRPVKIKVGTGDARRDLDIIRAVREATEAELCVDANGAWSIPEAVRLLPQMDELGVSFVEQPIADTDPEDWHLLCRLLGSSSKPALIADESARTTDDIVALAGAADGINVKLAKCGGIAASRGMIRMARALDLQVVLGCMVESSLAIGAASHLAPLADHVDLDGADLLAHDPYQGMRWDDGHPIPPNGPGIGVTPRDPAG